MSATHKLPLSFDPEPLQSDLQTIANQTWSTHFNTNYFDGDWSGVALRSIGGDPKKLYPDPHDQGEVVDTAILEACPNIRDALSSFRCEIKSARLLRLGPGSSIREHRDFELGREVGEVRLHLPLITNELVEFYLDGNLVTMKEGECWYLDFSLPHRVENRGSTARIHLVLDCVLNSWLNSMLPAKSNEDQQAEASSMTDLEAFRQYVLEHRELHRRLRATDDRASFARLVVTVGREHGFVFSSEDVRLKMQEERHNLLKIWIQ